MMITDDELEEFKKSNTFKMLVKGSYLGVMEKEFSKMTKKQLVDECFKKEAQIFDLKDQLVLTENALELACLYVFENEFDECADKESCIKDMIDVFKTKAKEMIKSE